MPTSNADRATTLYQGLTRILILVSCAVVLFGGHLAEALWRKPGAFYSFMLIVWGAIAAIYGWWMVTGISRLKYTVPPARSEDKGRRADSLLPYMLGTVVICFCFSLCCVAIRGFDRRLLFGAIALAAVALAMLWITRQKIKCISQDIYPPDVDTPGVVARAGS
jgi:L-asparagine transporter-like permease